MPASPAITNALAALNSYSPAARSGATTGSSGGLGNLLTRRRGATDFFIRRRKPKTLEELQMMQGTGQESPP